MRVVATRRLSAGATLGRDIPSSGAVPLIRAGVTLTAKQIDALIAKGINGVYVDDRISAGIDVPPVLSPRTAEEARAVLARTYSAVTHSVASGGAISTSSIRELEDVAGLIASAVAANGDAAPALSDLAGADAYTLQHSIDVATVGLMVAQRLFHDHGRIVRGKRTWRGLDERLTKLGVGLLLLDIGKLAIPQGILTKAGRLTEDEWEIMRHHPVGGLEMLPGSTLSPLVKAVVRSHHERWDGTGYPDGGAKTDIDQLARIASVADVFDAITSERPYAPAAPQHVAVEAIRTGAGTAFDPEVAAVFCAIVPPHPPGADLTLADGRQAIVVSVPPATPGLPVVRVHTDRGGRPVSPHEIALVDHPELLDKPVHRVAA